MKPGIYKGLYGGFIVIKNDNTRQFTDLFSQAALLIGPKHQIPLTTLFTCFITSGWGIPNKWLNTTRDNIRKFGELRNDVFIPVHDSVIIKIDAEPMFLKRSFEQTPKQCKLKK